MNNSIQIIPFTDGVAHHFARLNKAWLQKYFYVEPIDEQMLANPRQFFIEKGGAIFFAEIDGAVCGTFALMKETGAVYELGKMAVDEGFQGRGVGNAMLHYALQHAKELGAEKIILYSNTTLAPAIHLYKKWGFVEMPLGSSEYKRSNIKMERIL